MSFTQIIDLTGVRDENALREHLEAWHAEQSGTAPGYQGARLLADQDATGRFLVEVDFSSEEEARRNSDRPETAAWAEGLQSLTPEQPGYSNLRRVYSTSG